MKNTTINNYKNLFLLVFLSVGFSGLAQIKMSGLKHDAKMMEKRTENMGRRIERKAEKTTEKNINKKVEKGIDDAFDGKKNDSKADSSKTNTGTDIPKTMINRRTLQWATA